MPDESEFAGRLPGDWGTKRLAAIDVGSNSVRLLVLDGGNEKYVATTRLSAGLSESGEMSEGSMQRTVDAVARFAAQARERCRGIFVFATEAVRKAKNRDRFLSLVRERAGLEVDVLSGEAEAQCGFLGVSDGKGRISVLDIGGASAELATGETVLEGSVSVPVGTVRLLDACGRDRAAVRAAVRAALGGYEGVPRADRLFAIGGTATTLASTLLALPAYDRSRVHGFRIQREALGALCGRLFALPAEEVRALPGMDPRRADVIAGGAELLLGFLERFGYASAEVSECDNLEGYLKYRGLI